MNLRVRLLVLVILAILPSLVLIVGSGIDQRRRATENAREEALRIAQLAALRQDSLVEAIHQTLTLLAQLPQVHSDDPADCSTFMQQISRYYQNFTAISAALPSGEIYCSSFPGAEGLDISDRPYFQSILESRRFTAGHYTIDRATSEAILPFAYPVFNEEGQLTSVVIASINLDWMLELAQEFNLPEGAALLVVDNRGTILSRYPNPDVWIGETLPGSDIIQAILIERGEGYAEVEGVDGITRLYAFTSLHEVLGESAYVSIGIRTQVAYSDVYRSVITNLAALGIVSILAVMLALVLGDQFILRPVNRLLTATRRIEKGDLSARVNLHENLGEISHLATSFDHMANTLEKRNQELQQAEARYRTLVEQIPAITYTASIKKDRQWLYVSPQVEEMLGFRQDEWVESSNLWVEQIHPEDCERVLLQIQQSIENENPFSIEYRIQRKDSAFLWVRDEAIMVYGEDGKPIFLQGILVDITEHKQYEASLQTYGKRLERSNRELQDFAYIASHDMQEPLRKIQAFGERLIVKHSSSLSEEARDYLQRMISSASRMQTLINDLLSYSRVSTKTQPFTIVDLNKIAGEVVSDLGERIAETGGNVNIHPIPEVEADYSQMRQLLQNLVANALKFHKPGIPPVIDIKGSSIERGRFTIVKDIELIIEDNGIGFDVKYLDRIFQPFQRLHNRQKYEGTGIGLAICRKIVERHGGSITAHSTPGEGASFIITLPARQLSRERKPV
jgi:two-component system, LuxR family, sensor kinase FixL